MTLVLLIAALLVLWVVLALLFNCGEPLIETLIELAVVALVCVTLAVLTGGLVFLALSTRPVT